MASIGSDVYVLGCKTVVRTVYGNGKSFEVKVGMHHGSALSPPLFVIVMELRLYLENSGLPCHGNLLYTDDLAVIAEIEEELIKRLNEWKDNVESKGMRVSMNKTKVMISGERQKVRQKAVRWLCGSAVKMLVAIHYSVIVARNGYIRNVVV